MVTVTIRQKGFSKLMKNKMTKIRSAISSCLVVSMTAIIIGTASAEYYNNVVRYNINDENSVIIRDTYVYAYGNDISISSQKGNILIDYSEAGAAINAAGYAVSLQAKTAFPLDTDSLITIISTNEALGTVGISSNGPTAAVDVKSNLSLTSGYHGIYASYGGSITLYGNSKINTTSSTGFGIAAVSSDREVAKVDIKGNLEVRSNYVGLTASQGAITVGSGNINNPSKTIIVSNRSDEGKIAMNASNSAIISGSSIFDIEGNILVSPLGGASTIDLEFLSGSRWTGMAGHSSGFTTIGSSLINLRLYNSEWSMTSDSTLTNLLIDSFSSINFLEIYSTISIMENGSVSLAQGSSIILNQDYTEGDIVKLFVLGNNTAWDNGADFQNVQLVSTDQSFYYDYTDNKDGSFTIGLKHLLIPEPTTATLTLLGVFFIISRRKKDQHTTN